MALLDRLMRSWWASADLHKFRAGATEADIQEFESRAGWKLPTDWSQFYLFSNGANLFKECLRIYPLLGGERSLLGASARLRRLNWRVPEELWIAGDDGLEDHFGLWLPCATEEKAPVVQTGEIFEDDNLALAGGSLRPFLAANSAYLLLSSEATPPLALDIGRNRALASGVHTAMKRQFCKWKDVGALVPIRTSSRIWSSLKVAAGS